MPSLVLYSYRARTGELPFVEGRDFSAFVWVCGAGDVCGVCSGIHVRVLVMGEGFNISPRKYR